MATIKFGAIVTDMRGKLGGHVFQKGNQSRVMKTRASPRKANSELYRTQSTILKNLQSAWRALPSATRKQWNVNSSRFTFKNRFNDAQTLTGYQLFLKLNMNLRRAQLSPFPNPSSLESTLQSFQWLTANINTTSGQIEYVGTPILSGYRFIVLYAIGADTGAPPSVSRFVYLGSGFVQTANSSNLYNILTARVGPITAGIQVWFGLQAVSPSGFASVPVRVLATIS